MTLADPAGRSPIRSGRMGLLRSRRRHRDLGPGGRRPGRQGGLDTDPFAQHAIDQRRGDAAERTQRKKEAEDSRQTVALDQIAERTACLGEVLGGERQFGLEHPVDPRDHVPEELVLLGPRGLIVTRNLLERI